MSVNKKTSKTKAGRKKNISPLIGEIGELYLRGLMPGGLCCTDLAREKGVFTEKVFLGPKEKGKHSKKVVRIPDGSRWTRLLKKNRFKKYFSKEDKVVKGKRRTYYKTEDLAPVLDSFEKLDDDEKEILLKILNHPDFRETINPKEGLFYGSTLNYLYTLIGLAAFFADKIKRIKGHKEYIKLEATPIKNKPGGKMALLFLDSSCTDGLIKKLKTLLPPNMSAINELIVDAFSREIIDLLTKLSRTRAGKERLENYVKAFEESDDVPDTLS